MAVHSAVCPVHAQLKSIKVTALLHYPTQTIQFPRATRRFPSSHINSHCRCCVRCLALHSHSNAPTFHPIELDHVLKGGHVIKSLVTMLVDILGRREYRYRRLPAAVDGPALSVGGDGDGGGDGGVDGEGGAMSWITQAGKSFTQYQKNARAGVGWTPATATTMPIPPPPLLHTLINQVDGNHHYTINDSTALQRARGRGGAATSAAAAAGGRSATARDYMFGDRVNVLDDDTAALAVVIAEVETKLRKLMARLAHCEADQRRDREAMHTARQAQHTLLSPLEVGIPTTMPAAPSSAPATNTTSTTPSAAAAALLGDDDDHHPPLPQCARLAAGGTITETLRPEVPCWSDFEQLCYHSVGRTSPTPPSPH